MKFRMILFMVCVVLLSQCKKTEINSPVEKVLKSSLSGISASASSALWPTSNLIDKDSTTCWSSNTHTSAAYTEYAAISFSSATINYVQMMPRYYSGTAFCFPVVFNIYYKSGSSWVLKSSYTSFPTPTSDWIILPFTSSVVTTGIKIEATTLGADNVGNYAFQLGGLDAGYNSAYASLNFVSNNGASLQNEIRNVGSGAFNPSKISNWNFDYRMPLIAPGAGNNIYAPSVVYNGAWNVYFGGWDAVAVHDQVSITVSSDNFLTFGTHYVQVANGVFNHVNNENVIKKPDGTWLMYYTTLATLNKPGYATSPSGVGWTPSAGNTSYLITMSGYSNWANADVNGSNVIYLENGVYHLYFTDFTTSMAVHHATSTNGTSFTYTGDVLNENVVCQDVKMFTYNGTKYYLLGMHCNGNFVGWSMGTSPTAFAASQVLTNNQGADDRYITSMGFVTNGTRLYGILYGAGAVSTLDRNRIYAKWLQKKVIFISRDGATRWGDIEQAYGPDRIKLFMSKNVITGRYYIYDSDGSTLLYTSPLLTIRSGDIWQYNL